MRATHRMHALLLRPPEELTPRSPASGRWLGQPARAPWHHRQERAVLNQRPSTARGQSRRLSRTAAGPPTPAARVSLPGAGRPSEGPTPPTARRGPGVCRAYLGLPTASLAGSGRWHLSASGTRPPSAAPRRTAGG